MVTIRGYTLWEQVDAGSALAQWITQHDEVQLAAMDRGDDEGSSEGSHDKRLGRIELFQGVMAEYEQLTYASVQAGLHEDWPTWERLLDQKDKLAVMVGELGWRAVFHISDRAYHRRIVEIAAHTSWTEPSAFSTFDKKVRRPWADGGLCLGYPPSKRAWERAPFTADEAVAACLAGDGINFGTCYEMTLKAIHTYLGALTKYPYSIDAFRWMEIFNVDPRALKPDDPRVQLFRSTGRDLGHAFIAVARKKNSTIIQIIQIDPSNIGMKWQKVATYEGMDVWRGAIATYLGNLGAWCTIKGNVLCHDTAIDLSHELYPLSLYTYSNYWPLLEWRNRYKALEDLSRKIIRKWPRSNEGYVGLAAAFSQQGGCAKAEATLRKGQQVEKLRPHALVLLAYCIYQQGRTMEAKGLLHDAIADFPEKAGEAREMLDTMER